MQFKTLALPLWAVVALLASYSAIADEERLSLDWIFSEEGKSAVSIPAHVWLQDGTVLLYDERVDTSLRTIEAYDPANGRRREVVSANKVLVEMTEVLSPDEPFTELEWPDAIASNGRWAAYEKSDDLVVLNLANGSVLPVAVSEAEESSPKFSPDGRWLAFVRDNDLYVWDIARREEKRLTKDGGETLLNGKLSWVYWEELYNRSARGFEWSPDSSAIAYLQSDESGVGKMHYVDFEPNLPRLVTQRHPKPGEANPRVRAGVVDLATAKTTWIDLGAYPHEYLARMNWLPDSRRLSLQTLNRSQTTLDIFLAIATTGESSHLIRERDPGWVNVHDDLYFLGDRDQFIWLSERDGNAHLYLYGLNGELVRQITSGDWSLRPSGALPGMDQAVSYIDENTNTLFFTRQAYSSTDRQLYRIGIDGTGLQRITEAPGTHAIRFSPDGMRYLDAYSSLEHPPALQLHRADGGRQRIVVEANDAVTRRFDLQPWTPLEVAARDGFKMPAMMLKPRFFDPVERYPAIVYVYGGPSAPTVTNSWQGRSRDYYHQLLADSGVIVFYVDNRSAAGQSKTDANLIVEQLYGAVELDDLTDAVTWLKDQPYIDQERVGVWGWSGGGTMTLQSMTSSEEFAAGVAVAPVTDWHYYDTIYTERYMKRPDDNEAGYAQTSHVKRAANLHGRLLLVHGTYDDNVHPQNSWAFSDGLIEAGITFDMMIYPMRKHGISDDAAQLHLFRTMYEFWDRQFALSD